MSLNDLKLSPSVLAALYPSSLINEEQTEMVEHPRSAGPLSRQPESESMSIREESQAGWKYLGNNQKKILIIVSYEDVAYLPDEELNFLTTMLTACKLSLDDVAILNHFNYRDNSYKDFLSELQSKIVFLFGVEPFAFKLPVSFPYFQVQNVAGCTFLYTPALELQRKDALLKSKLWVSLRTVFGI